MNDTPSLNRISNNERNKYEFLIIGGGSAGALLFYYLSKFAPESTCLIEKKHDNFRFTSAKIIVEHARQYLHKDLDIWAQKFKEKAHENKQNNSISPEDVFLRDIDSICNSSRNLEGPMFGKKEFGSRYGQVVDEQNFIRWHLEKAIKNGAHILKGYEVVDIKEHENDNGYKVFIRKSKPIKTSKGGLNDIDGQETAAKTEILYANMIILATGSAGAEIQKKLGFEIPFELNQLIATFWGRMDQIDNAYKTDYFYHLHPKISTKGPLQMTKGRNWLNFIYVSDEDYGVMDEKFERILKNYPYIRNIIKDLKPAREEISCEMFVRRKVWKHPISKLSGKGVILIGEATGFVTPCYYEGFLGNFVTARIAADILKELFKLKSDGETGPKNQNIEIYPYTAQKLSEYDKKVRNILMKNFYLSQDASERMFLMSGDAQFDIWDAYIKAINNDKKVRHNIWSAWASPKLIDYPLKNDEYCGERIYFSLPLILRMKYTPFFLKMKFS